MTLLDPPARAPERAGRRRALGALFVLVMAVQVYALYVPRVTVETPTSWADKVVHPLIFLVPLVVGSLWLRRWKALAVVLLVHAPVSELVQHFFLPQRDGDVWDAVADIAGIAVGLAIVIPVLRLTRSRSS